jgi:hypothetical protein
MKLQLWLQHSCQLRLLQLFKSRMIITCALGFDTDFMKLIRNQVYDT